LKLVTLSFFVSLFRGLKNAEYFFLGRCGLSPSLVGLVKSCEIISVRSVLKWSPLGPEIRSCIKTLAVIQYTCFNVEFSAKDQNRLAS
jgi:hypothetical protein